MGWTRKQLTPEAIKRMGAEDQAEYGGVELNPRQLKTDSTEAWEQRQFAAWLKDHELLPPAVWHNVAKRSTGTVGCPDFIVPVYGALSAVTLFIEFKKPGEELSPDQQFFARRLKENGHELYIAYSWADAVRLVEKTVELHTA